jgi:N-formylmaleamate deformylase
MQEKRMAAWFSGDVMANGIKTHYFRTGGTSGPNGDKPPLVLLHGATDNGLCWTRLARVLESQYDVIMPDARGHGLSDAPESGYTSAERAADLAGFIGTLRLEQPAVAGHSMGAGTALRLVADYPQLASCAILEDPGLRSAAPDEADQDTRRARARQNAAEVKTLGREGIIARGRQRNPAWADEEFGPWADAKLQVSERFATAPRFPERPDWRDLLPRVTCPVLLITADPERGGIVTPERAAEAQRLLPGLRTIRLAGAGHNVRREQFEPYLRAVQSFLDEVYRREERV